MQLHNLGNIRIAATGLDQYTGLPSFLGDPSKTDGLNNTKAFNNEVDLELSFDASGLKLKWNRSAADGGALASLNYHIDINKLVNQLRSFPAPKQGAFNQALGKKSRRIVDATGGWGGDALLMCTQGYDVTIIERQPVMALLLTDAMRRLAKTEWAINNNVTVPKVVNAESIEVLQQFSEHADCVYLDPMFPPKKKQSAAVNKNMQLLHWMVGEDLDANALAEAAILSGVNRVAVKRPDYAEPLYRKPSTQFSSKLVHYDVYLAS